MRFSAPSHGSRSHPRLGYWLGTGLPYCFIDPAGPRRLDFLEIPVSGDDNVYFWKTRKYTVAYNPDAKKTFLVGLGLTEDEGFQASKRVLDRAMDHYYSASGFCWHPVYLAAKTLHLPVYATDTHFRKCVAYAKSRGIGLTGTNAWNNFWRAREKVAIEHVVWNPESATLQYKVPGEVKVSALSSLRRFGSMERRRESP